MQDIIRDLETVLNKIKIHEESSSEREELLEGIINDLTEKLENRRNEILNLKERLESFETNIAIIKAQISAMEGRNL